MGLGNLTLGVDPMSTHDLRSSGGRRRPQIRDKIPDCEINFMTHRRNKRKPRVPNRKRQALVVETPKILNAPSTAGENDEVTQLVLIGGLNPSNQCLRSLGPLH